jgi:hypothetical protein
MDQIMDRVSLVQETSKQHDLPISSQIVFISEPFVEVVFIYLIVTE